MPDQIPYRAFCERAYDLFHRAELISPDPLEVVREESDPSEREIVALIASSLALGRVEAIVSVVRSVVARLREIDPSLRRALLESDAARLERRFGGFVYRFFDQSQIVGFLSGIAGVLREHGSLENAFALGISAYAEGEERLLSGLRRLVDEVVRHAGGSLDRSILLSHPEKGSAIKRLCLFARWLVRSDEIDPGGWRVLVPSDLLIPVDTHVIRVARHLGMTSRAQPSLLAAREITESLRRIDPDDPVRFDFSLTRPGINPRFDESLWLDRYDARPA